MKKVTLAIGTTLMVCLLCAVWSVHAKPRNILLQTYSEQDVLKHLAQGDNWVRFPDYADREGWNKLSASYRSAYIQRGEAYLGYDWPAVNATVYLDFSRTGNRAAQEKIFNERRKAFQSLVMAELAEGKGRFLDDIINGIFSYCEQTYWGYSAHFYLYRNPDGSPPPVAHPTTVLPNIDDPIIDLGVGEVAADLAWAWYFFKDEFDKVSPIISKRVVAELKQKVIEPYYTRDDYWWITGWGRGAVNNWTPWCNQNVLQCILLVEDDPEKKAKGIYKSMRSVDLFLNSYEDDGACSEGPSYWGAAGAKMFEYLGLLKKVTDGHVDIFDNELVKNMGRYIYRVYIGNGNNFVNFADAPARMNARAGLIYRYGQAIDDSSMQAFGAFLLNKYNVGETAPAGSMYPVLEDIFSLPGWDAVTPAEPLIDSYYFPDMQIAIGREHKDSNNGFYFAAKGGSNGEQHNHNDVGSFILFYNGNPVFVDAGVGSYTAKTFSAQRYDIWTMQSLYHNLPAINGVAQKEGGKFKATGAQFNAEKNNVDFSVDIAQAYPAEANVASWVRSYSLQRAKQQFVISDRYRLNSVAAGGSVNFVTDLESHLEKPGLMILKGADFAVSLTYDPKKVSAKVETVAIDDNKLSNAWGPELHRLVFEMTGQKTNGGLSFTVKNIEK